MRRMFPFILLLAGALLPGGCAWPGMNGRDGVIVHISSGADNPQRVLMALNMAVNMSADRDVLVYMDVKGIEVALKDSQNLTYAQFSFSRDQIKKLVDKGVGVYACPDCLSAAGKTQDDLLPGVKIAEKDAFFFFTSGRIITLDY